MKTLIVYDNDGKIFINATGDYTKPTGGIQYLEVEVPNNHYVEKIEFVEGIAEAVIKENQKTHFELLIEQVNVIKLENDTLKEEMLLNDIDADYRLSILELGL